MSDCRLTPSEALSLYEVMLRRSDNGFLILDLAGNVVHANEQAISILSLRHAVIHFADCVDLPNRDKAKRMLTVLAEKGQVKDWEMSLYNGFTNTHVYFSGMCNGNYLVLMLKPLDDSVQNLHEIVIGINNDLTNVNRELARKQMQLEKANRQIQEMHAELSYKNKLMQQDLQMAKVVQRALLERVIEPNSKLSIEREYHPADTIGGDLYDVVRISEHLTGILICDVSGHGVGSALVMAVLKNIFRNHGAKYHQPHEYLEKMNHEFLEIFNAKGFSYYATAFYIIVDTLGKCIYYSGAGHPYPCHYRQSHTEELIAPGYPIGLFETGGYITQSKPYQDKDRLLLYTDGFQEYIERMIGEPIDLTYFEWGNIKTVFKNAASALDAKHPLQTDDVCMMIVEFIVD